MSQSQEQLEKEQSEKETDLRQKQAEVNRLLTYVVKTIL